MLRVRNTAEGVVLIAQRALRPAGKAVTFDPAVPVVLNPVEILGNFSKSTRWDVRGNRSLVFNTNGALSDEQIAAVLAGLESTGLSVTVKSQEGVKHG